MGFAKSLNIGNGKFLFYLQVNAIIPIDQWKTLSMISSTPIMIYSISLFIQ